MIQRLCPRCHSVLHLEDENTLVYCWNCGAPRVTLSEELQEQAAEQMRRFAEGLAEPAPGEPGTRPEPAADPTAVNWREALRLAALVAAVISAISIILPPLELLAWTAPAIVLAIYGSRFRQTVVTTSVGARLGVVCGIFSSLGMTIVTALQLLLLRFGLHGMSAMQANMDNVLLQARDRVAQQSGQAAAAAFTPFLTLPEFRVGFFLAGLASVAVMLMLLSVAGGAFSGFMRSRARMR